MKLNRVPLVIALLACTLPAPALAQQPQQQAVEEHDESQPQAVRTKRSFSGGRFTMDIAGQNVGLVSPIGSDTNPPVVHDPNARAAVSVSPSAATRPGAIVVAPAADDNPND